MRRINQMVYEKAYSYLDFIKEIIREPFPFLKYSLTCDEKLITGNNAEKEQSADDGYSTEPDGKGHMISTKQIRHRLKKRNARYEHALSVFEPDGRVAIDNKCFHDGAEFDYIKEIADHMDFFNQDEYHQPFFRSYVADLNRDRKSVV